MADPFTDTNGLVSDLTGQMGRLESVTAQFGKTLSKSLVQGIVQGKSFEDMLKGLGDRLITLSLNAAMKPLEGAINGLFGGLTGMAGQLIGAAFGAGTANTGSLMSGFGGSMLAAAAAAPVNVTMNVTSPDASSFAHAESQISAALARAVARGQRSL